jgi:hypothetical protein
MNWYELSIILGLGVCLFFFVMFMFAKFMVRRDVIHRCKTCGEFMEKGTVDQHMIKKHGVYGN